MNVVVLGAGVIGCAIAYYLAQRGIAATVIEALGVACAASGKSGGFLARDWCDGQPQEQLARVSFDLHQDLARTLGRDYGYRTVTTLAVTCSARGAARAPSASRRPAWLDGDCVVRGVLGDTTTTAQLDPAQFTEALLEGACARGARLQLGTAEGIVLDGDRRRVTGVRVDGECIAADAVVVAMGPWAGLAASWLPLPDVAGLKGYSITLAPSADVPAQALFVDYEDERGAWHGPEVVARASGEVYLCGFGDDSPVPASAAEVGVDESACARLATVAARLSGVLGGARVRRRQACYRPICRDALPVMGALERIAGAFVATGHNCWGMLNAPGSGYAMAELIAEGVSREIDLVPFAPSRLPPSRPFTP